MAYTKYGHVPCPYCGQVGRIADDLICDAPNCSRTITAAHVKKFEKEMKPMIVTHESYWEDYKVKPSSSNTHNAYDNPAPAQSRTRAMSPARGSLGAIDDASRTGEQYSVIVTKKQAEFWRDYFTKVVASFEQPQG